MAINFNSGLGNQMMGGMNAISAKNGSVLQSLKEEHGCEDCFRRTPQPPAYTMPVMPVPREVVAPSFWTRLRISLLGS